MNATEINLADLTTEQLQDLIMSATEELKRRQATPEIAKPEITSTMIEVEMIGDLKGWIAELTPDARNRSGFKRTFIGTRDYSRANKPQTRGVYSFATLTSDKVYEINDPRAWGRAERYFATVVDGELVRVEAADLPALLTRKP